MLADLTVRQAADPTQAIDETGMFETVERSTFRFWQPLTQESLRDLVASRSHVAMMSHLERERVLRAVDQLYEEYGRGHDGMLLPYVTTACRTAVLPWAVPEETDRPVAAGVSRGPQDDEVVSPAVDDSLLIDFR